MSGLRAAVMVGDHRLEVYFSGWSGLETYSVDGKEVLRVRRFGFWGKREIPLPDGRKVVVEVAPPFSFTTRVRVDGLTLVENLFPLHRVIFRIFEIEVGIAVALSVLASWLEFLAKQHP